MAIPHVFNFFWSWGTTISYLRYLSIATCRHHHPNWEINLYQCKYDEELSLGWDFGDFQSKGVFGRDYSKEIKDVLGVNIRQYEPTDKRVLEMPPPSISDIFSYEHLYNNGGWYADMDVIFVKEHDYISDQGYAFIGFANQQDWVGQFGACKGSWVMKSFLQPALDGYDPNSYNSTGTFSIIQNCSNNDKWARQFEQGDNGLRNWRCPADMFYPLMPVETDQLWKNPDWEHSKASTWSVHLYGGNADYALANKKINPEYIMNGQHNEWLCRYIRKTGNARLFLV